MDVPERTYEIYVHEDGSQCFGDRCTDCWAGATSESIEVVRKSDTPPTEGAVCQTCCCAGDAPTSSAYRRAADEEDAK